VRENPEHNRHYRLLPDRSPELRYPCRWRYKLIGHSSTDMHAVVDAVTDAADYSLTPSKTSAQGSDRSFALECTVFSEAQRTELFHLLREHPAIKVVL